jgi:hypothetical protein
MHRTGSHTDHSEDKIRSYTYQLHDILKMHKTENDKTRNA